MTTPRERAPAQTASPVLVITGPTASGKTALSVPVARELDGEVVSMDSRQVYRGMDIATDKVRSPERHAVPHHGLDGVDPDQRYSAGRWAREARRLVAAVRDRGRLPLLVGGTGFYLKALLEPIFREPEVDEGRRDALRRVLDRMPQDTLEAWVRRLDPARVELAAAGGRQRLSRTAEVPLLTGRPLSWWHRNAPPDAAPLPARIVLLELPREVLYARIDARARAMFDGGLLDEVRGLLEAGYGPDDPGMTGTGYREAVRVLRGEATVDEAVDQVQRATRAYARRQLTWFRNQLPPDGLLRLDALLPVGEQAERVVAWWRAGDRRIGIPE